MYLVLDAKAFLLAVPDRCVYRMSFSVFCFDGKKREALQGRENVGVTRFSQSLRTSVSRDAKKIGYAAVLGGVLRLAQNV